MSPSSQARYHPKQPSEEDQYVLEKREKARERQRRKRARDKSASVLASFLESHPDANLDQERELAMQTPGISKRVGNGRGVNLDTLPPGEAARREKIRIAARERQRRHRAGVKAKRMAELGMAIVNAGGGVEQTAVGYTINANGQYEAVLADTSQNPPPPPSSYPVPHPHATPGQTFSSTLLLALSCAPLLKQHLLRTLRFTNEDLAAFEPVIAAAFDHWDHGRALYYASHGHHTTSSSYLPPTASYSQQYDLRDRSYKSSVPPSSFPKSQVDLDESMSASDGSRHSEEQEQCGIHSGRTKSFGAETREREEYGQKERADEREDRGGRQEIGGVPNRQ